MTFRVVRTNQYNQDLGLIHSTNGNHLESPKEGSSIDHQVTIYLHAQNITMFPTNETCSINQISSRKKTLQNDTVPTYQNDVVALYQQAADLFKTTNDWFQLQHPKRSVLTSSNDVSVPTQTNPVDALTKPAAPLPPAGYPVATL
ncbi:hypothetical protein F511_44680 [Dorcoceras hygrometricum]|uniref:Uncharacterized protein n=1 Tax=Dorcoceras hygrometricum TaxID=472368 RepID=A0A2Z6ZXF1_9LAMI|nr:hypothetical protein F511_44680 [Dorcoceras hygrometricum]